MKILISTLGFMVLVAGSQAVEARSPNVLFIAVDDMNDWIGCLGGYAGKVHTPNMDRLAERGVLFATADCP
jgi:arylsulfatase A-like enzyme